MPYNLPSMAGSISHKNHLRTAWSPTDYNLYASDALIMYSVQLFYVYSPYGTEIRTFKQAHQHQQLYFD